MPRILFRVHVQTRTVLILKDSPFSNDKNLENGLHKYAEKDYSGTVPYLNLRRAGLFRDCALPQSA